MRGGIWLFSLAMKAQMLTIAQPQDFYVLKTYNPHLHYERGGSRAKSKFLLCEQLTYGR